MLKIKIFYIYMKINKFIEIDNYFRKKLVQYLKF